MAITVGNNVHANSSSASSLAANLSANNDSIIVVSVTTNGGPVTSITSANGETFTFHGSGPTSGTNVNELWTAATTSSWTNNAITVNTNSASFLTWDAFEVRGADTTTRFDADATVPDENTSDPGTISTDTADDIVIGGFRMTSASATQGDGYTTVNSGDFQHVQYEIVSGTVTSKTVDISGASSNGMVATAIIPAATATTINAPAASLAYTMVVPTVSTGVAIAAAAATLAYTFQVPTVTANPAGATQIDAPSASLSYTMLVPTVATGVFIDVPAATLAYLMRVPTVNGAVQEAATRGGLSMSLQQMRRLERKQLLAMLREDDEVIVSILSAMGVGRGR